LICKWFEFE